MGASAPPIVRRGTRWREELPGNPWRWALAPLTIPAWACYRLAVTLRNQAYDRGWIRVRRLPVPVVSVGNLTAGGTGKTPAVIAVCARLRRRGWNPMVLSRGYRGGGGANDEAHLLGDVAVVCDPDRVAGGHRAIAAGADCLVLDDGAQHRQLHRDCDILLIDATRPGDACLPLGWLREPWTGLRRGNLLWISRAGLVDPADLAALEARLPTGVAVVRDVHRAGGVTLLSGGPACPATSLGDRPLILASGLGNPRGFELAARLHGWHVVASWRYPDHHAFTASDVTALATACREHHAELVVTAKDAVKLAALAPTVRTWVLAAGDQLDESGLADLDRALDPHFPNRT